LKKANLLVLRQSCYIIENKRFLLRSNDKKIVFKRMKEKSRHMYTRSFA